MFDIIIKNAKVIDGTSNPWFKADIGIKDEKISIISNLKDERADYIIDATNLFATPGFIDSHTHADFTILANPRAESLVRQGVTTLVVGNCGHAVYPVKEDKKELLEKAIFGYIKGIEIDWKTLDGYLRRLKRQGIAANVAPLSGHCAIRIAVMGFDNRKPTESELDEMKKLVEQDMRDGSFGLSTGLEYPPGSFALTEEIIELCKVVSSYGGFYSTHIRNRADKMIEATKEAIKIGEAANVPVLISHHVPRYPSEGLADEVLRLIDEARSKGLDVVCDALVPFVKGDYLPNYMWASTNLISLLPSWAFEGGVKKILERLKDKNMRRLMIERNDRPHAKLAVDGQWHRIMISSSKKSPEVVGKTIKQIAEETKKEPWDVVFDALLKEGEECYDVIMSSAAYLLKDGIKVMLHPTASIISDGLALATSGPLASMSFGFQSYGYIPYFFKNYVFERKLLTFEEGVRKCTSLPAIRLGLKDRGLLREGMYADIVLINKEKLSYEGTLENPNIYAKGIEYVIVNGKVVIEKGEFTNNLPGKPLRKIK